MSEKTYKIDSEKLISHIKTNEGFVGKSYKDNLGFDTIGYGTKLPLTHIEADLLLRHRLNNTIYELYSKAEWINDMPEGIQSVLKEMAYQMGVNGLLKFKNTITFLKENEFYEASVEMLDSVWYKKQTPNRAKKLSDIVASYQV